jgi:hypothetical protein
VAELAAAFVGGAGQVIYQTGRMERSGLDGDVVCCSVVVSTGQNGLLDETVELLSSVFQGDGVAC